MELTEIKKYIKQFIKLWNEEFKEFPMNEELMMQNAVLSSHLLPSATKALVVNKEFVGLVVTKIYKGDVPIEYYNDRGHLSLIYVKKSERNKGYGTFLLNTAVEELKRSGKKYMLLGQDLNVFFPGIPNIEAMNSGRRFLEGFGFKSIGKCFNLLITENPHFTFDNSYTGKVATLKDKDRLLEFIKREFSGRWFYEAKTYFENGGDGREFAMLLDKEKVIGFARINDYKSKQIMHNINWSGRYKKIGGIGPLGVDKEYRGKKLGTRIVNFGVQTLFDNGCSDVLVDWTGITAFYEKSGFKICDEFLCYQLEM